MVRPDGGVRWVSTHGQTYFSEDRPGAIRRALRSIGVVVDITDRKQGDELRDVFLGMLSHELRTPVTAIFGGSQLLRRTNLDEGDRREIVNDIVTESERLERLVENLLVLARAERHVVEGGKDPVMVRPLLERIVADKRRRWPDSTITVEVAPGLPPAQWDESSFELVVRNLISNAIKYGDGTEIRGLRGGQRQRDRADRGRRRAGPPDRRRRAGLRPLLPRRRRAPSRPGRGDRAVRRPGAGRIGRRHGLGGQPADRRGRVRVPDPGLRGGRRPARRGVGDVERISRVVGPAATNVHVLADERTREAIAIDTAIPSLAWITDELAARGWTLRLIISTHGHWDHIGDNAAVAAATGAQIAVHAHDREALDPSPAAVGAVRDPAVGPGGRAGGGRRDPLRLDPPAGPPHAGSHAGLGLPPRGGRRACC